MTKIVILACAALLGVLAATNPHQEAHSRALVEHAKQSCGKGGELGRLLCGGAAAVASMGLSYEDHLLYSTARLGDVETVGVLGQVIVRGE